MTFLKQLWLTLRSNPYFVGASSAFVGALMDTVYDELQTGHVDLSRAGLHKLLAIAGTAVFLSLYHLYMPRPQSK